MPAPGIASDTALIEVIWQCRRRLSPVSAVIVGAVATLVNLGALG